MRKWIVQLVLLALAISALPLIANAQATAAQYLAAGDQLYSTGDYEKALQYYQAAAQLDPNNPAAWQGIGNSDYSLGRKDGALAAFEKSLSLNPDNPPLASLVQSLKSQAGNKEAGTGPPGTKPPGQSPKNVHINVGLGSTYPISHPHNALSLGGSLGVFRKIDKEAELGAILEYTSFSYSNRGSSYWELLAAVKYRLNEGGIRPYLLAGAGIDIYNESRLSIPLTVYGAAQGGVGLEFVQKNDLYFFIQAKLGFVQSFWQLSLILPVQAGIGFGL
jgi:tetratricopeptide (TPR) repeat protein